MVFNFLFTKLVFYIFYNEDIRERKNNYFKNKADVLSDLGSMEH